MERDDIIRMAREAGLAQWSEFAQADAFLFAMPDRIERFAALVAANEREQCAQIAKSYGGSDEPMMVGTYEAGWFNAAEAIAADIRARGEA